MNAELIDTFVSLDLLTAISLACVLIAVVCSLLALFLASRKSPQPLHPAEEHFPVAGRIEKLERSINEFRTDTLRALSLMRKDIDAISEKLGITPAKPSVTETTEEAPVEELPPEIPEAQPAEVLTGEGVAPAQEPEKKKSN